METQNWIPLYTRVPLWSLPQGDSLEITFDIKVFSIFWGLFLIMQLFEICDKKHMIWCSCKGHNLTSFIIIIIITKFRQKSVRWYALSVVCFFSMLLHFGVSVVKHMKLNY